MKKFCLALLIIALAGFSIFADTDAHEEIDFLLFLPDSGNQFVDEDQALVHLDNLAAYLIRRNPAPGQILVAGYTAMVDNSIDSLELSMERAIFVRNELQRRGVPGSLFSDPVAYGAVDLWGSTADEEGRSPNRRVRILLDGIIITPAAVEPPAPAPQVTPAAVREEPQEESGSGFPWWLLLLPLLVLILFLALRKKKKEKPVVTEKPAVAEKPAATAAVVPAAVVPVVKTYTYVNLEEEIRNRAYELYVERHGQSEDAYEDWCRAVIEICAKYKADGYETYSEDMVWWAKALTSSDKDKR